MGYRHGTGWTIKGASKKRDSLGLHSKNSSTYVAYVFVPSQKPRDRLTSLPACHRLREAMAGRQPVATHRFLKAPEGSVARVMDRGVRAPTSVILSAKEKESAGITSRRTPLMLRRFSKNEEAARLPRGPFVCTQGRLFAASLCVLRSLLALRMTKERAGRGEFSRPAIRAPLCDPSDVLPPEAGTAGHASRLYDYLLRSPLCSLSSHSSWFCPFSSSSMRLGTISLPDCSK